MSGYRHVLGEVSVLLAGRTAGDRSASEARREAARRVLEDAFAPR